MGTDARVRTLCVARKWAPRRARGKGRARHPLRQHPTPPRRRRRPRPHSRYQRGACRGALVPSYLRTFEGSEGTNEGRSKQGAHTRNLVNNTFEGMISYISFNIASFVRIYVVYGIILFIFNNNNNICVKIHLLVATKVTTIVRVRRFTGLGRA